jgi:hypothetical protein
LDDFDVFTQHMRGIPRLRPTLWCTTSLAVIISPDSRLGLQPLEKTVAWRQDLASDAPCSAHILDVIPWADVPTLPVPYLAPLFVGLCGRYLKTGDDVAMMAAEQLVDGMDLDEAWYSRNISSVDPEVEKLSRQLIKGKAARLDDFSGNLITCFVASEAEAKRLRKIPGFDGGPGMSVN